MPSPFGRCARVQTAAISRKLALGQPILGDNKEPAADSLTIQ